MKVLIVTPLTSPDVVGGVETYVERMVEALSRRNLDVVLCSLRLEDGRDETGAVRRIYLRRLCYGYLARRKAKLFGKGYFHLSENLDSSYWDAVAGVVEQEQPDVVFSQSTFGFGRYRTPRWKARWVHYVHGYELGCFNQAACGFSGGSACRTQCGGCCRLLRFKHGKLPQRLDHIIYNSRYMQCWFGGTDYARVPSSVLHPYFEDGEVPLNRQEVTNNDLRVAYVGALDTRKGLSELCEAVAKLGDQWSLDVVGAGPLKEDIDARGYRNVTLHGRLFGTAKEAILAKTNLVAVPSLWEEPFGLVALEALARGIPLVVSDSGELPALVGGDRGLVFSRAGVVQENIGKCLLQARADYRDLKQAAVAQSGAVTSEAHVRMLLSILAPKEFRLEDRSCGVL